MNLLDRILNAVGLMRLRRLENLLSEAFRPSPRHFFKVVHDIDGSIIDIVDVPEADFRANASSPVQTDSRTAGALYDRVEGRQRWALIQGNAIAGLYYHAEKPAPEREGDVWVPVVHEDSEPFDIARHWRLKPHCTIADDRVIVTFPVVAKSWEHA